MGVPDNSGFASDSTGTAAPGWYVAQGDPPDTERYWNGSSWEGTYRAVGGFSPSAATPRPDGFPGGAKTLAWVITVLKAIPLVLIGIALAALDTVITEIEQEADINITDNRNMLLIGGGILLLVGGVLLVGQIRAVSKENTGQAAIWAGIITVFDVLNAGSAVLDGQPFSIGIAGAVLAAQGYLFYWMFRLHRAPATAVA